MPRIPLIGPSNTAFSLAASATQSMNCYLETIEGAGADGKNKYVLRGRPGMRLFKDLSGIDAAATAVRGLWSGGGRLFVAANTKEFEVDVNGALVGSVNTIYDGGTHPPVTILSNSNQLLIVSDGKVYCDNGAGPTQITFPALSGTAVSIGKLLSWDATPNGSTGNTDTFDSGMIGQTITYRATPYVVASVVNPTLLYLTTSAGVHAASDWSCTPILSSNNAAFMDGYFVAPRIGTRKFNSSALLDGSTWAALDVDLKEGYADNIQATWTEPPFLYMLGTETLQVYRDTAKANGTPFEPVDGGFSRTGLAATWSMASLNGKLHMLAGSTQGNVVAVRMEGASPVRVSTHAVAEALKSWAFPSQGVAYSYVERDHLFWVINFTGGSSWVYDATESALQGTPQWHERASWSGSAFGQYTPWYHTFIPEWGANGMHIVGDAASGKLYELHSDYFDDNVTDIKVVRALPYIYNEGKHVFHHRIEFELETGTAGTAPVVKLDWSDDRGRTWGTGSGGAGTTLTLGPGVTGAYTTRYFAVGLGSSRGRVYRISITGQGRVALIDAVLEATFGTT